MGHLPLHRYELFHSSNQEYVCEMMGRILGPEHLEVPEPNSLDARLHTRRLFDTSISFLTYGTEVVVETPATEDYFAIHLPLTGKGEIRHGRAPFTATPAAALVVSPSDTVSARWFHGSAKLIIRIERVALEAQLANLLGECLRQPLRFAPEMDVARGGGATVANSARYVATQLDTSRAVVDNDAFVREFERMLMVELLTSQPHSFSDRLRVLPHPATSRELEHAVSLLASHPEQPHALRNVAAHVAVSARSLQRSFQLHHRTSFQTLLQGIRMRRLHDELLAAHPHDATVREVMAKWRLPIKGQTYAAYRRRYGETPMDTLRRGA